MLKPPIRGRRLPLPIVGTILFGSALHASAQSTQSAPSSSLELIDPAAFGFSRPSYLIDATIVGTQDFERVPGGLDFAEIRTLFPVAAWKVGDIRIGLTLGYNLSELGFDGLGGLGDETLHTLQAQVGLFWRPEDSRWWGLGLVSPGLNTDFEAISWDDFAVSTLGLVGYRYTDSLSFAGGLFARYETDDSLILPALGLVWQKDAFTVQLTPPFIVLGWKAADSLTLSLSTYPSGGSWDLDGQNVNRVDLDGWQMAASILYQFNQHVTLSLRAGINVGGELELRDRNDRSIANQSLDSAPFGAMNLRWQF